MIFVILILTLLLGIGMIVYYNKSSTPNDEWEFWGGMIIFASIIFLIIATLIFVKVKINEDIDYQSALAQKQMIEYRIEQGDNIAGNELLYTQIVDFNNDLRRIKKFANNIWLKPFYNQKIATMEYIKIEGLCNE